MSGQRTPSGSTTPKRDPAPDAPPAKPCAVCDEQFRLTGERGGAIEYGGQVLCGGCMGEPVVFEAHCDLWSCDWTYRVEDTEFHRHAARQLVQMEANNHETEKRVFEKDHFHSTEWTEVEQ